MTSSAYSSAANKIKKFTFPKQFDGRTFYEKYKTAAFLKDDRNVRKILSQGYDILECLNAMSPGKTLTIEGMFIKPDTPLVIKKSALIDESDIDYENFTYRRLSGLVAVFALRLSNSYAFEAEELGLEYEIAIGKNKKYLSAVSGAEYFCAYFGSYPLVCALRKYQMKKISSELLLAISQIRNKEMVPMVVCLQRNFISYEKKTFQGNFDLRTAVETAPAGIKRYFKYLPPLTITTTKT